MRIASLIAVTTVTLMSLAGCQRGPAPGAGSAPAAAPAAGHQSPADLSRRVIERRAVEAVIWGMPAVNFQRMLDAAIQHGAAANQVVYWSRPVNSKNQTLTPNADTIYINPFYDTTNGPVVLEIPPVDGALSITGTVDDAWQNPLEDVGPAGVDKGTGAKYLITPPGYTARTPAGHLVLPSTTYRGFAILRSNFKSGSDADIAAAVEYGKRVRIYPLGRDADSAVYVDVYDKAFDATIPYDAGFYESLSRFVQAEPWLSRDRVMIDMLKSIGIEKGTPFNPDTQTRTILETAPREARAYIDTRYEALFDTPFGAGTRWALPSTSEMAEGMPSMFANPNSYPIDARAVGYSMAYFYPKHLGTGQFYLMTIHDKTGQPLSGRKSYRLTVPPNAPVRLYWSATLYDRETHALIRNSTRSSRGSNSDGLHKNADGSVSLYFGPSAPSGADGNWIPTNGRDFEVLFRFYGPEEPLFKKTWVLPDVEEVR
jgi:hypothetical protein